MIQLQFLNKLLDTKDITLLTENNFDGDYFSDYRAEYNYIKNHIDNYGVVPDKETFLSTFPNFDNIVVNEPYSYLIEGLIEDYNKRYIAESFNKVRTLIMNNDVDAAMDLYKKNVENIKTTINLKSVDILQDTSRYKDYVDRIANFDKFYIKTGFPELDEIIGGWDRQEELATIAARTNVGKSWCLIKMAAAAVEQGLTVGLYSGEMSERKVGYRLDTLLSHISNGALIHGNENVRNDYKRYIDNLPTKYNSSFKVLTPSMINGPAGVNALKMFIEKEHLDILFVDQHSLLEDDRKAKNPVERASNISKDLKNLQVMKKIPIISVSQQNRSPTDTGIGTEHIAQSDRISQDSTIIIFFEKKDDILKMHLVKSRDSENGKDISYNVDFNKGIFTYIPNEKDGLGGKGSEEYEHRYDSAGDEEDVF